MKKYITFMVFSSGCSTSYKVKPLPFKTWNLMNSISYEIIKNGEYPMAFETKEQVLEKILSQKKPVCPHCGQEMSIWEVPPFSFSDGLGWGTPYLFICFNNDCPVYMKGWDDMMDKYAHNASVRCMCYPGTKQFQYMPVFSTFPSISILKKCGSNTVWQ